MENQGNMQSGKKAAVIYFLAAFFIACIGIAIAVRHLLKKRNRKIAGIIVFLFVAGFFSWQNSGIWQIYMYGNCND